MRPAQATEFERAMSIEEEIKRLGALESAAAAIVDYVRAGAHQSKSEFSLSSGEWTLNPDNWISLKFTYLRKVRIQVSLGVFPENLEHVKDLEIKPGRFRRWSKLTIASIIQLPAAMRCIEEAYFMAENSYRSRNGKPRQMNSTSEQSPENSTYSQKELEEMMK